MIIIENLLTVINSLLTFYIPTFYTFKFLMNNNHAKVKTILKFWCVLTIYHLMQWLLSHIIAENLFPIIDLIVLIGLNWKEFEYAQLFYDNVIGTAYANHRDTITKLTTDLERIFNKKTEKFKSNLSDSTTEKFKGMIGQILVGALNPTNKQRSSESTKQQQRRDQDYQSDSDKDE